MRPGCRQEPDRTRLFPTARQCVRTYARWNQTLVRQRRLSKQPLSGEFTDEATSHLDVRQEKPVNDAIRATSTRMIIAIVLHGSAA